MRKLFSGAIAVGAFAALYYLEKRRPLRRQIEPEPLHTARNLTVAALAGITVNALEKPLNERLTGFVETQNIGLLKFFRLPKFLETAFAVLLLDYTLYLWHVLTHKVPLLWRFHRMHHADLDLTASTAVRFHFVEMAMSIPFRAGQILIIGVSPRALQIWQTLLFASIFFHHSNWRLPKRFEEKLELFIVTPRLHGIHHSNRRDERDSNWSSGLTLWDFLHKTFRNDISQAQIVIGIEEFDAPEKISLGQIFFEPFAARRQKAPRVKDNF